MLQGWLLQLSKRLLVNFLTTVAGQMLQQVVLFVLLFCVVETVVQSQCHVVHATYDFGVSA